MTDTPEAIMARAYWRANPPFGVSAEGLSNMKAAIAALHAAGYEIVEGWKPIDSAPRDGTEIDLWFAPNAPDGGSIETGYRMPECCYRDDNYWKDDSGNLISAVYITHWRPRPAPPEGEG